VPGKGVCCLVGRSGLVNDLILEADKLCIKFVLPRCVQALVYAVYQAALVGEYDKLTML
jgi:hypothetical protein